jgi:Protein of unknown function (DUF2800)
MRLRCSKLPLFFECPSSASEWERPIDSAGDAAKIGTVVHLALAAMVRGEEPELTAISRPSGVDIGEVERLFAYGKKAWKEIGPSVHAPCAEMPYENDWLSGTCDVESGEAPKIVVDWKSGQVYRDHKHQMRGYAFLARDNDTQPVKSVIVWLQLGFYEVYDFTADELNELKRDIDREATYIGKKYSPGADCAFCRGRAECKAKADYERMAANALTVISPGALSRDRLAALYPQARLLEKAIEAYTDMLRAALADGPLVIPDGRQIELKQFPRQEILAREAWPILAAELTQEELAGCTSITKGKLMDAIGAKAAKGCKGKDQGRMLARLKEAGAISESSFVKIQVTKAEAK